MHHINKKPKTLELPQKLRPNTVYNIPCSLGISAFSWYETNAIDILTAFVLFEITIIFKLKTEIHEICKKKKKSYKLRELQSDRRRLHFCIFLTKRELVI